MSELQTQKHPEPEKKIITVRALLQEPNLVLPEYQRPYRWTQKHVAQLFDDLQHHRDKSAYRLGTVVFHREHDDLNIVDGQQRTITLMLIAYALFKERLGGIERPQLKRQLETLQAEMKRLVFSNAVSQRNIQRNYRDIARRVARADFDEDMIDFWLNHCQLVSVTLSDVSEAFQFFDAQNARGRDLEPHDLLKAFHLREFGEADEDRKAVTVATWENSNGEELATLFTEYLSRIRRWSKGESARFFGKEDVPLFKGVNIDTVDAYPYVKGLRAIHHTVDDYNQHFTRRIDGQQFVFPFQLDQVVINGRRFFEMIEHYQGLGFHRSNSDSLTKLLGDHATKGFAKRILETLDSYEGRKRTGDQYVRGLFDCLLMYYCDKFGVHDPVAISRAVEKAFIWAYSLRLKMQNVQLASADNHVIDHNLFRILRDAVHPQALFQYPLETLEATSSTRTQAVEKLFREMRYLDDGQ